MAYWATRLLGFSVSCSDQNSFGHTIPPTLFIVACNLPFHPRGVFMKELTQPFCYLRQLRPAVVYFIHCNVLYFVRFLYSSENWQLRGLRDRAQILIAIYHCQEEIKQVLVGPDSMKTNPLLHSILMKTRSYKDFLNSIDSSLLISNRSYLTACEVFCTGFALLLVSP